MRSALAIKLRAIKQISSKHLVEFKRLAKPKIHKLPWLG